MMLKPGHLTLRITALSAIIFLLLAVFSCLFCGTSHLAPMKGECSGKPHSHDGLAGLALLWQLIFTFTAGLVLLRPAGVSRWLWRLPTAPAFLPARPVDHPPQLH